MHTQHTKGAAAAVVLTAIDKVHVKVQENIDAAHDRTHSETRQYHLGFAAGLQQAMRIFTDEVK